MVRLLAEAISDPGGMQTSVLSLEEALGRRPCSQGIHLFPGMLPDPQGAKPAFIVLGDEWRTMDYVVKRLTSDYPQARLAG